MTGRFVGGSLVVLLTGLAACSTVTAQDDAVLRARGKQLFTDQGCYGCHIIDKYGTPIAQDLSHLGGKYSVAEVEKWLRDPAAQKPTAHMPKIGLNEDEVRALAAYLGSLR